MHQQVVRRLEALEDAAEDAAADKADEADREADKESGTSMAAEHRAAVGASAIRRVQVRGGWLAWLDAAATAPLLHLKLKLNRCSSYALCVHAQLAAGCKDEQHGVVRSSGFLLP